MRSKSKAILLPKSPDLQTTPKGLTGYLCATCMPKHVPSKMAVQIISERVRPPYVRFLKPLGLNNISNMLHASIGLQNAPSKSTASETYPIFCLNNHLIRPLNPLNHAPLFRCCLKNPAITYTRHGQCLPHQPGFQTATSLPG